MYKKMDPRTVTKKINVKDPDTPLYCSQT